MPFWVSNFAPIVTLEFLFRLWASERKMLPEVSTFAFTVVSGFSFVETPTISFGLESKELVSKTASA